MWLLRKKQGENYRTLVGKFGGFFILKEREIYELERKMRYLYKILDLNRFSFVTFLVVHLQPTCVLNLGHTFK